MLNFDVTKKCLVGEGWCPVFAKPKVHSSFLILFPVDVIFSVPTIIILSLLSKNLSYDRFKRPCNGQHLIAIHRWV